MSKEDAKEEAEIIMSNRWNNQFEYISGRKFFQQLSYWTQEEFSINISAYQVASYFHIQEIPIEIKNVISKISQFFLSVHFLNSFKYMLLVLDVIFQKLVDLAGYFYKNMHLQNDCQILLHQDPRSYKNRLFDQNLIVQAHIV